MSRMLSPIWESAWYSMTFPVKRKWALKRCLKDFRCFLRLPLAASAQRKIWSLELIVISGNHILSTNYILGTVLRGYGILKLVAAQWLIKAWLRELVEALGGKTISTPNKAWSSEHGVCAPYYIFPPHTHRCRVAFYWFMLWFDIIHLYSGVFYTKPYQMECCVC